MGFCLADSDFPSPVYRRFGFDLNPYRHISEPIYAKHNNIGIGKIIIFFIFEDKFVNRISLSMNGCMVKLIISNFSPLN